MYKIPILLIIYNRPSHSKKVFSQIRKIKPKQLFIFSDYPHDSDSLTKNLVYESREIANMVDWDCSLKTNFSEEHLGCKLGVTKAINWFFSNVEKGVILEDDCFPKSSFFKFCEILLHKYKDEEKVFSISGTNLLNKNDEIKSSYLFSYYGSVWGWATWKRAWEKHDPNMKSWKKLGSQRKIQKILGSSTQYYFRKKHFDKSYNNKIDTWDYAWSYTRLINNGLTIVPKANLIKNIGFGKEATHTKSKFNAYSKNKIYKMQFPLLHPDMIVPNRNYDYKLFLKLSVQSKIYSALNLPFILFNNLVDKMKFNENI